MKTQSITNKSQKTNQVRRILNQGWIAIFALTITGTLLMQGCKKEETKVSSSINANSELVKSSLQSNLTVDNIGVVHNASLDYIYNQLNSSYDISSISLEELSGIILELNNSYFKTNYNSDYKLVYGALSNSNEYNNDFANRYHFTSEYQDSFLNFFLNSNPSDFSDIFLELENSESPEQFEISANEIITNSILPNPKKEQLTAYANVCIASYYYWTENISKWDILYGQNSSYKQIDVKKVVKADCEWAVTGALAGAGLVPMGWLAGAGIAAPLGSAWETLWQ